MRRKEGRNGPGWRWVCVSLRPIRGYCSALSAGDRLQRPAYLGRVGLFVSDLLGACGLGTGPLVDVQRQKHTRLKKKIISFCCPEWHSMEKIHRYTHLYTHMCVKKKKEERKINTASWLMVQRFWGLSPKTWTLAWSETDGQPGVNFTLSSSQNKLLHFD